MGDEGLNDNAVCSKHTRLPTYMCLVWQRLASFLNGSYIDVAQTEIEQVAWLLTDASKKTLPTVGEKGKKRKWFRDAVLKSACTQSKEARRI